MHLDHDTVWLTIEAAAQLASLPVNLVYALVHAGWIDTKLDADDQPLVNQQAWLEYVQTLGEVLTDE